jgi:Type I phosphodiesterase / nucleotide pyrophosphatase
VARADWIAERGWVRPDHGGACFDAIPGTITALLTGETIAPSLPAALVGALERRYERVVLVYFDALSFEIASRHADHPLLARAASEGVFERITSQFPSTTTAHMPTIHSGRPVAEHGLYEWFLLEPSLDRLIAPLPFTFAGDGQPPLQGHLRPEQIYPDRTLYEWLGERDVATAAAGPTGLSASPASSALLRGVSEAHGFRDLGEGLATLAQTLAAFPAPAYGFVYIDDIDSLMHKIGPGEPAGTHVDAEVDHLLTMIEQRLLSALPEGTLLLITSDHGMTSVSPPRTIYLNAGEQGDAITAHLRRGAEPDGHPLAPAGSCRDLFLHAEPGHLDDVVEALERLLGSRAEVRRTRELLDAGLFGPRPSAALTDRLGDVVILPELGEAVYWYTPRRFRQSLWGQHGGLTPQEMEIPLIAVPAG